MAAIETLRGTITFLPWREGAQPGAFEFELRLRDGTSRLVRVVKELGAPLREGQNVVVTGSIDANKVLVAASITADTPSETRRAAPWLILLVPPIAMAAVWTTAYTTQEHGVSRTAWVMIAIALLLLAQVRTIGRPFKVVIRTIGGASALTAFVYEGGLPGATVIIIFLLLAMLSFGSAIAAVVILLRAWHRRATDKPPAV